MRKLNIKNQIVKKRITKILQICMEKSHNNSQII